jgi:hypothetical protein
MAPGTIAATSKRSFLRLPVDIDVDSLLADYRRIPHTAWSTSHWDVHCSATMLLLRGGHSGDQRDFTTDSVVDHEILAQVPYIAWLLGADGPFGQSTYGFIFRMRPNGVTRPHVDDNPSWRTPMRIHIAITTNDEAHLLSEGRAMHLDVGEAWTFDNQRSHAVVNGDTVRTHLIFDVPPNPKLSALLDAAVFDPGEPDEARWQRASLPGTTRSEPFVKSVPLSVPEKLERELGPDAFASRVTQMQPLGRISRSGLRVGDIIRSVDGVHECEVARTATDYIQVRHRPGEVITLDIERDGTRLTRRVRLRPPTVGDAMRSARNVVVGLRQKVKK